MTAEGTGMTDDEAFIRAIVAAPGDDAPRLVYADWLDDRGDARGAYLRAEVERVKDQMAGGRAKAVRQAKGLDPVWAARVSRPPAGVCSQHLGLSSTGPGAEESDIDAAGATLDVTLPPQFRALLLNYSLGQLRGGPFVLPRGDGAPILKVGEFVCLIDPDLEDGQISNELVERTEWLRDEYGLDAEFVFLASTFYDNEFVVSCRQSDYGSVHLTDGFQMQDEPGTGVQRIADAIGELLTMLQPRTWPLTDE
jgi:uncharacterized protein (TIGR02996 family)